ncbi:immunity protein Imm33 domain-containing protein [Erythrobacter ani]|uniref:DUF2185 domain-containing protein n=1 Tax=Erythrobacter ani TaxID=2827235 RepID=A0ABS6SR36_9SPHN|nr:DUF2185 domain-containing protein [Erythrobacter ani]MBV7267099.1 DUF2185 domain-containing protein [Erythrobacter ani]
MSYIELPDGVELSDPRPTAAANPYTYFMPHPDELAALQPKDGVKAIFHQPGCEGEYDVERMWVLIDRIEDGNAIGTLDNEPSSLDKIKMGDPVRVPLTHVVSTAFHKNNPRPVTPDYREYWERCFVDSCVVEGRCHADYIYREEPDMAREGDKYPDSGWRVRGTDEAIAEDERRGTGPIYVAIGKVLNADDNWLHLIDREFGVAFQWDAETWNYIELG